MKHIYTILIVLIAIVAIYFLWIKKWLQNNSIGTGGGGTGGKVGSGGASGTGTGGFATQAQLDAWSALNSNPNIAWRDWNIARTTTKKSWSGKKLATAVIFAGFGNISSLTSFYLNGGKQTQYYLNPDAVHGADEQAPCNPSLNVANREVDMYGQWKFNTQLGDTLSNQPPNTIGWHSWSGRTFYGFFDVAPPSGKNNGCDSLADNSESNWRNYTAVDVINNQGGVAQMRAIMPNCYVKVFKM